MKKMIAKWIDDFNTMLSYMSGESPTDGTIIRYDYKKSYVKKKHLCLECGEVLENKKREAIVNSQSEEAKKYDFYVMDGYAYGNIKFVSFYFECPVCGKTYEIKDYVKLERNNRRNFKLRRKR